MTPGVPGAPEPRMYPRSGYFLVSYKVHWIVDILRRYLNKYFVETIQQIFTVVVQHTGVFALKIISNNAVLLVILISTTFAPLG